MFGSWSKENWISNFNVDFNVIIRSIVYDKIQQYISVMIGSAITINSDPLEEYEESGLPLQGLPCSFQPKNNNHSKTQMFGKRLFPLCNVANSFSRKKQLLLDRQL